MPAAQELMPGTYQHDILPDDRRPMFLTCEDQEAQILLAPAARAAHSPGDRRLGLHIQPLKMVLAGLILLVALTGAVVCLTTIVDRHSRDRAQLRQLYSKDGMVMMFLEDEEEEEREIKVVSRNPALRRDVTENHRQNLAEDIMAEFTIEGGPYVPSEIQSDERALGRRQEQSAADRQTAVKSSRSAFEEESEDRVKINEDEFAKMISGLPDRRRLRSGS